MLQNKSFGDSSIRAQLTEVEKLGYPGKMDVQPSTDTIDEEYRGPPNDRQVSDDDTHSENSGNKACAP